MARRSPGRLADRLANAAATVPYALHQMTHCAPDAKPAGGRSKTSPMRLSNDRHVPYRWKREATTCWPVSSRVGNVKNNDPSLIEPISAQ